MKVERRLENNLQPDIQLLRQGAAIAAIEIFVTHSVDREKAAKLQALCLPWVEIKGKPALYTGHEAWHIDIPLPVFNTNHILDNAWLCEKCFTRKVEMEKRHQWLENNGTKPLEYKLIDFFYPYGRWMRNLFIIECTLENGKQTKFTLTRFTTSLNYDRIKYYEEEEHIVAASSPATDTRAVIKKLKEEERKFLLKIKKEGVILDSPMPWIEKEPSSFEFYDLRNFPRRYFFNKKTRQWFIPKDRNLVVWFNEQGNLDREITYWHRP